MRWCTVTVTDPDGRRHSVDVQATSTFEAAHLFVVEAKKERAVGLPKPTLATMFEVVAAGKIYHVTGAALQRWIVEKRSSWKGPKGYLFCQRPGWNNGIAAQGAEYTVIRIGPAGWKYKDWEGVVYPQPAPRGFDPLAYIAEYFTTVETNSSYYGPPQPGTARRWVNSVSHNRDFRFTAKLYHSFTHERKPEPADERDYKAGVEPIADAGRLEAILIQFPWSFKNDLENREYLWALQKRFQEYPLVVEIRHASWITDDILDTFAALGLGLCNIDQPLFHRSVKPAARTTSPVGYVRLHGRNYQNWFSPKADVRARYDYLYRPQELEPWVARIKKIAEDAEDTYAVTNNHNLGKATVNALELEAFLSDGPVRVPPVLMEHYPDLQGIAKATGGDLQNHG